MNRIYKANQLAYSLIASWIQNGNDSDFALILDGISSQENNDLLEALQAAQILASRETEIAPSPAENMKDIIIDVVSKWYVINNNSKDKTLAMAQALCIINLQGENSR